MIESLLNSSPEISYSILRYLISVVKKYPEVVGDDYSHFICDYKDPFYIKIEKMEIMFAMINKRNAKKILNEFYEYHKEINPEFVKLALKYIYKIALKVRIEAPYAIAIYKRIIESLNEGSELFNDIAIGAAVIIRSFPKVKGGTDIVKCLSKIYKSLWDQEAKVAFIWLLGEYCEKVEDSGTILEHFSGNFFSQTSAVQLQVLNSGIKMYLNEIPPIDEVLQSLLQQISDKSTSPDLRDRGYIYWRLLFQSPEKASEVVFNDIPPILIEEDEDDMDLINQLIKKGGSVSSHLGFMLNTIFTKKVNAINRGEVQVDSEYITTEKPSESNENQVTEAGDADDHDILGGDLEIQENNTN
jgi:vesicle coat complex subunit